jgi:DNA-binding transcriptional ArsR family regulator
MSAKGSQVFDAIAEGSRREILDLLAAGPRAVGEIAIETGLSQPNASRHLRILREAGLVEPRVEGQRRIYELRPAGLAELIGWVAPYRRLWQGSLDALERHLDRDTDETKE